LTTSLNPYFLLWWATIGAWLILNAREFGAIVVVVFAIVHWSCDLGWYMLTSYTVFRTKHLWTPRIHQLVFVSCGVIMVVFGLYFVIGPAFDLASSL
jgi:threonine/homoserine/homoserine lactone efflux protein